MGATRGHAETRSAMEGVLLNLASNGQFVPDKA